MQTMRILWCLLAIAPLLNACAYIGVGFIGPKSEGAKFYEIFHERGDYGDRSAELEKYPLEQQYEIFLYGMQKVHPPDTGLASAIAKRGKPALDYVLRMVAASDKVMDYVDSMKIFGAMVRGGHYLVCDDVEAMKQIWANGSRIAHEDWKKYYLRDLGWMREDCAKRRGEQHGSAAAPRSYRLGVSGPTEEGRTRLVQKA